MNIRFVGLPRALINTAVGEMEGWKHFGERVLEHAKATCPVGEETEGWQGPHLKDTLMLRLITGTDPRILIGSKERGAVLSYVTAGTEPHSIDPVNASALRFTSGGTIVFATHVDHPGHPEPNPFIIEAAKAALGHGD